MKTNRNSKWATFASCLLASLLFAGCASTKMENREMLVTGPITKPGTIWVYHFAASASELPAESVLASHPDLDAKPQTAAQIAEGQKLGAQMATELVIDILNMGMPAAVASADTKPRVNDLVIRGYLVSVNQGDELKRVTIGFGDGASSLKTVVEGFQMTHKGLRKLGSGEIDATGAKSPGGALGLAVLVATHNPAGLIVSSGMSLYGEKTGSNKVEGRAKQTADEIADVLKKRFVGQGWVY